MKQNKAEKLKDKWAERAKKAAQRIKKRVSNSFDTWQCDFEPTGKCRWIGFLRYPPSEYGLYCVCCRLLSLEEAVREAKDDVAEALKEVRAALEELSVLLLKLPTEVKK